MGVGRQMVVRRYGRRRAGHLTTAAGLSAVLLGTVTGCGGDAVAGAAATTAAVHDPRAVVRGAADVLARAGSSQVRTALEMANGGTRVTARGRGGFDYRKQWGRLRISLPHEASGAPMGRPVIELIAPGDLYMKNRGAGVPPDKWVWVDTTSLADGNLVTGGATDPLSAAELLRGARQVAYEGSGELHGVPVRHYSGVADIRAAARAATGEARKQLAAAAAGFTDDDVPFDAWFDRQGRLRKVGYRFSVAHGGGTVDSTTSLSGFGTPVTVTLPAQGDIYTGAIASPGSRPGG
jgi:hypothetical protein